MPAAGGALTNARKALLRIESIPGFRARCRADTMPDADRRLTVPDVRYRFGRCELHPAARRLFVEGRPVVLGGRAFDLLLALIERRGRVVGKDELLEVVWPGTVVEENNLAVQVSTLRKQLGGRLIATVAGRGYQFTGELRPLPDGADEMPGAGSPVPAAGTRLIGRAAELAALDALLREHRLVTLAGPGGIGKTRLALAWCHGPGAERRLAWVDLAGATDPDLLPALVLAAVGGTADGGPVEQALRTALASQSLTLVLDNAESLAAATAALARSLLDRAPGVRLLVTSQVPLRLPHEQVLRLGTLDLPEGRVTPAQALAHGAVALFVERARAADPAFELAPGNLAAVLEICTRLDGLPLALELAAARVPTLGVTALAGALDERLRMLGDAQRSAPARQRTLRAALEWSCGLLDAPARRLFRRLGAFAASFPLDAALAVAEADDDGEDSAAESALATLGRLVEDSLLTRDGADPPRYRLLESARLYALEQLERSGEAAATRARHLAWCLAFVRGCGDAYAAIAAEYPNLRAALEQALARAGGDRAGGAALAVALLPYWQASDTGDERRRWLEPADPAPAADPTEATVARLVERLQADGLASGQAGDPVDRDTVIALARRLSPDEVGGYDGALAELGRAVEIARRVLSGAADGDGATDAFVADVLAGVAEQTRGGDFDRAADALDDALAELERRAARYHAALQRSRRELLEAGVQQDLLRRDAFAVARRIEAIAALDAPARPTQSAAYRAREAEALADGRRQGVALSLAVAVELARRRLAAAADADERRAAALALAAALTLQGQRETREAGLDEAIQHCRAALADGEPAADERAALQHALAEALLAAGERRRDPAPLEEAVVCCQAALRGRLRDREPQAWADSQALLGRLLAMLGERDAGSERLLAAIAALREAQKVRTRARSPLEWGRIQRNIGVALACLARHESSLARQREAADAFREALRVLPREQAPVDWAMVQANLGIVLAAVGEDEPGLETLQQAVDAYREALRELTRERLPSGWAKVQHNLGGALRLLGEREAGTQSLRESVLAFREAMREHTRERLPRYWAAAKNDQGMALLALGRREAGTASLVQAVQSLQEALDERPRDASPVDWARTQADLAQALFALGERQSDAARVAEAEAAAAAALEVLAEDVVPRSWQEARALQGAIRRWRAAARRGVS